jgi:hypothetical protein
MDTTLLILVVGTLNVVCFFLGAKVGQSAKEGKEIDIPIKTPMALVREHQDSKKAKKEQERLEALYRNIERYDGTSNGQEDIPRG